MANHQISLFEEQHLDFTIKKHSALAQMNNVTNLVQRKSINAFLRIAKDILKRNPNNQLFTVDLGVLKKLAGITNNDNSQLKKSLKSLVSLVIEYNILGKDNAYERGAFSFLSHIKINGGGRGKKATVEFSLPLPILQSIAKPRMYVKLNLFLQRGFKSKYGIALFELLLDYKAIGSVRLPIEKLRQLLGLNEGQYSWFGMFREKVLDLAVKEINHLSSDIRLTYILEREGRKYTFIQFTIIQKKQVTTVQEAQNHIVQKLKYYGFNEYQVSELLKKHDEDYLLANITVVEEDINKGKKIERIKAYLAKAFVVDYRTTETEYSKQQEAKVIAKQQQEIEKAAQEEQVQQLKIQYQKERKAKIETLQNDFDTEKLTTLKVEFENEILATDFFSKMYKTKGFEYAVIQTQRHKFLAERFLARKYQNFENYEREMSQSDISQ